MVAALRDIKAVTFLNPYDVFCSQGDCHALVSDKVVYSDPAHLSLVGSRMFVDHFADQIIPASVSATTAAR